MRVVVQLWRKNGALDTSIGRLRESSGRLRMSYRTVDMTRRVAYLTLLDATRPLPNLFEPRVVEVCEGEIHFLGLEREGDAWVLQEWRCRLT